jgi:hypothetical protein
MVRKAAEHARGNYNMNTQTYYEMYKSQILALHNLEDLHALFITYTLCVTKSNARTKFLQKNCLIKLVYKQLDQIQT